MLHMLRIHSLRVRSDLLAAVLHMRFSRALRRISMRASRVEATCDIYGLLYGQSSYVIDLFATRYASQLKEKKA